MFDISVIIPAYNAEHWVDRAITSALNQTVKAQEILVIDDGSIDGTARFVQKHGSAIRYFWQRNSGPSAARNLGINKAECEWIAFLDADDEWLSHKIEWQLRVLERDASLKWCGSAYHDVDHGSVRCPPPRAVPTQQPGHSAQLRYFSAMLRGVRFGTCGFVIHRSVFKELGGFDPEMRGGEDTDMWCRIALKYPWVGYCYDPCWCCYNDNVNSARRIAGKHRDLQFRSFCKNMRRALELGPEVANEFRPYARMKVFDDLIRMAARDCFISSDIVEEAAGLFPLTIRERGLLAALRLLPSPVALRMANRFRL